MPNKMSAKSHPSAILKATKRICIVLSILVVITIVVVNGYYVKEERDYGRQITLSAQQIYQLMDEDDCWMKPDKGEKDVANILSTRVGKCMTFSFNNDLQKMQGNCEGQAIMCSAAINYAFKQRGFKNCYAKPIIVQCYCYNINMNKVLSTIVPPTYKHFVVNHCVTKIHYSNGVEEYFDTSLLDGAIKPKKKR